MTCGRVALCPCATSLPPPPRQVIEKWVASPEKYPREVCMFLGAAISNAPQLCHALAQSGLLAPVFAIALPLITLAVCVCVCCSDSVCVWVPLVICVCVCAWVSAVIVMPCECVCHGSASVCACVFLSPPFSAVGGVPGLDSGVG